MGRVVGDFVERIGTVVIIIAVIAGLVQQCY